MKKVMELSWMEIDALNKEKVVLFIGIAPIEQHGRHLPIGVDFYETAYWIDQSITKLEKSFSEYTFLTMPVIPFGYGNMKGIVGNIHLSQKLIFDLMLETLIAVKEWGIVNIVVISGHADPKHLIAIEQACEKINQIDKVIAFSPMGGIFSGKVKIPTRDETSLFNEDFIKLSQEMDRKLVGFPQDFHAGWIETSCMLNIKNHLVKEIYREQPDIIMSEKDMIFPENVMKKTIGFGHMGFPKEATAFLGEGLNEDMSEKIKICSEAFILRKDYQQYEHHELYKLHSLRVE